MGANHNASYDRQVLMDRRRAMTAELLVKRPGITQRQIHAWLGQLVEVKDEFGQVTKKVPRMINPETGEPFSLGTVHSDIDYIRQSWRDMTAQEASHWLAQQLAALQEAEGIAWRKGDTAEVRAIWSQRNKILGLDAPLKIAKTNAAGQDAPEPDVISIYVFDDKNKIRGQLVEPKEADGSDDS